MSVKSEVEWMQRQLVDFPFEIEFNVNYEEIARVAGMVVERIPLESELFDNIGTVTIRVRSRKSGEFSPYAIQLPFDAPVFLGLRDNETRFQQYVRAYLERAVIDLLKTTVFPENPRRV